MKKVTAIVIITTIITLMLSISAVASPESGGTNQTTVSYTSTASEWTWSVPTTQAFTSEKLSFTGKVDIKPKDSSGDIKLKSGTKIAIAMASANAFKLKCGLSEVAYEVTNGETAFSQNAKVLEFTAGTSSTKGVEKELTFATTQENISAAKLAGNHKDTLTFTVTLTEPTSSN